MEYIIDQERLVCNSDMEYVDYHESENSDDLRLARGIFNGFIIELLAAAFIVVVVTII